MILFLHFFLINITFCNREISSVFWSVHSVNPPAHPQASVSPPLDPKGGAPLACGWGGGGSQFGRLDRKPGTLYTLWLRLWDGRQWKRQSSWTQWTSTPSAPLPQQSPRSRLLLVQGQSENFAFNFSVKDSTLQRKSHLCISFMGIARPQSKFPHSCVCERFILYIPRIGPHIFLQQNRQADPGNI